MLVNLVTMKELCVSVSRQFSSLPLDDVYISELPSPSPYSPPYPPCCVDSVVH